MAGLRRWARPTLTSPPGLRQTGGQVLTGYPSPRRARHRVTGETQSRAPVQEPHQLILLFKLPTGSKHHAPQGPAASWSPSALVPYPPGWARRPGEESRGPSSRSRRLQHPAASPSILQHPARVAARSPPSSRDAGTSEPQSRRGPHRLRPLAAPTGSQGRGGTTRQSRAASAMTPTRRLLLHPRAARSERRRALPGKPTSICFRVGTASAPQLPVRASGAGNTPIGRDSAALLRLRRGAWAASGYQSHGRLVSAPAHRRRGVIWAGGWIDPQNGSESSEVARELMRARKK